MPNNTLEKWEEKTVKDVTEICLGLTHTPKYVENGVPFLSVKDISSGFIDFSNTKFISREEFDSLPNGAKPKKGDVLFARVGTLGCPSIVDTDKEFGTFVSLGYFRPNTSTILNTYLRYWMLSPLFWAQVEQNVQGSTLKNLNTGWLKNFKIPVPPLSEQQRIVGILDEAFENIEKAKQNTLQNLNNAKELLESNLNFLFNSDNKWNEVKLEEIADITSSKRIYKSDYVKNGIPFYRTKEIKELAHNFPISIELYISEEKFNEIENKFGIPKENDLLISAVGTIGEIYVVKKNDKFYFKDGNLIWFRNIKENVNTKFLKYILRAYVKTIQNMTNGAAYNALTIEKLKIYNINLPPLEEQQKIVSQLDALQEQTKRLEQIYTQKLQDLDELKQSILQKAFRGEL